MLLPLQLNNLLEPADGALSGSSSLTFTASGTLTGDGALSGSSSLTFTGSGTLTGTGDLSGSSSLTFTGTGTLTGTGDLSGTAPVTFTATGTLTNASDGAISGSSSLTFTGTGTLTGTGALSGASDLTFTATGTLTDASTAAASGGHFIPGLAGIRAGRKRIPQAAVEAVEAEIDEAIAEVLEDEKRPNEPIQRVSRRRKYEIIELAASRIIENGFVLGEIKAVERAVDILARDRLAARRQRIEQAARRAAETEQARIEAIKTAAENELAAVALLLLLAD